MNTANWALTAYCVFFCLIWYVYLLQAVRILCAVPFFRNFSPPSPAEWPCLSIVIAARNEAESIEPAVSTLLRLDYPDLEIILVDDRSTDGTGALIDSIAAGNDRLCTIHIKELPSGWLGKVHALYVGTQQARGEWILYTDADVHFRQGLLRKAVAHALENKLDHLALMPVPDSPSFWAEVVTRIFGIMFLHYTRAVESGSPGSQNAVGVGAFNLVRKATLEKTEGFPWLRMEIADDVGLGFLLKRAGARSFFAVAQQDLRLIWYSSLSGMFRGLEKNFFGAMAHYSVTRMFLSILFVWGFVFSPAVSLLPLNPPVIRWIGAGALGLLLLAGLIGKFRFRERLLPSLLSPVGHLILSFMLLRSGILCMLRGGITWRGTRYDTKELRAGQRVFLKI